MSLPSRVLECFLAAEPLPDGNLAIGVCALGYEAAQRVFDDRRVILARGIGGRTELGLLKAVRWAAEAWPKAEAVVLHLGSEYLVRGLESVLKGERLPMPIEIELAETIELDRIDRPTTPRMEEATALSKQGRYSLILD